MPPTLIQCSLQAFDAMSTRAIAEVLDSARALQLAARASTTQPLLRGKNLGLMCEAADEPDAALFRRAATELGAQVAHIRPSLSERSTPSDVQHTARMLGRLYDAVECQGMAATLVMQVGRSAGVPIYDALASEKHPTHRIADMLGGDTTPDENRRFVLQAVLLGTVA